MTFINARFTSRAMPTINDNICKVALDGWCNQLGSNPKNYLAVLVVSIAFSYGIPFLSFVTYLITIGNAWVGITYIDMLSPVFPGLPSLFAAHASIGIIAHAIIILVIDALFFIFMIRQIGIYVVVPAIAEVAKIIIVMFFPAWVVVAIILSVIPFMPLAVGAHFVFDTMFQRGLLATFLPRQ